MKNLPKKARAYALKNAITHGGKAQIGAVISPLFLEGLKRDEVKKYSKKISEIVKEINSLTIRQQEKEFKKLKSLVSEREVREGLEELPSVSNRGMIMRFAPSASGPLHIGHAMTSSISYLYVKKYKGKFYIRIEDTNPDNIYKEAYKMIEEDTKWLFEKKAKIFVQSMRMEIYYKYVEKLLNKNAVYVCTCSQNKFKKYVDRKTNCPCRKLNVRGNSERWKKMLDKSSKGFKEGEAVLRFRSNMKDKNPAMRDFPLARINLTKHPLQRNKYRVWPLMNLSVSVDDIEMKITHIIRGKDHRDNSERQKMIFNALNKKFPWVAFLGRFKFKGMNLSTTEFRRNIEERKFRGWDDSRLPTLVSLRKQGFKPWAFWKFAEQIGLSENDKVIDKNEFFTLLNSFNKKD